MEKLPDQSWIKIIKTSGKVDSLYIIFILCLVLMLFLVAEMCVVHVSHLSMFIVLVARIHVSVIQFFSVNGVLCVVYVCACVCMCV